MSTRDELHGDTVLDFSCQKQKSLLVEIFFVGHS